MVEPLSLLFLGGALEYVKAAVVPRLGAEAAKRVFPRLFGRLLDGGVHESPLSPATWATVERAVREELGRGGMADEDVEEVVARLRSGGGALGNVGRDRASVINLIDVHLSRLEDVLDRRSRARLEDAANEAKRKLYVMTEEQVAAMLSSVERRLEGLARDHAEIKQELRGMRAEQREAAAGLRGSVDRVGSSVERMGAELGDIKAQLAALAARGGGEPGQAEELVRRAEGLGGVGSLDPVLLVQLAEGYERQGELGTAVRLCERAVKVDPKRYMSWYRLGMLQRRLEAWDKAAAALENAAALKGDSGDTYAYAADARRRLGDVKGAVRLFQRAVDVDPTLAPAWTDLGELWLEVGGPGADRALECFERAVTADERAARAWGHIGFVHAGRRQPEPAARAYLKAAAGAPDVPKYRLNLAIELFHARRFDEAARAARDYAARWPDDRDGWELLGDVLERMGRRREAEDARERAKGKLSMR